MTSTWFVPIASYLTANYIRKCVGGGDETSKKRKIEKRIMTMKITDHGNDMVVPMGWQKRWWMVMAIRWWRHCIITNHHYPHHHSYQNHHNSTRKKKKTTPERPLKETKESLCGPIRGRPLSPDSLVRKALYPPCPSPAPAPAPPHTRPTALRETIFSLFIYDFNSLF